MSIYIGKEMGNRGVRDSVSDHLTPIAHRIPWSDGQCAHSDRDSTSDRIIPESPRIDVSVRFLVAGGECA